MKGIAVFYKEKGQSSYDVIRGLKKRLSETKIGHGGTLDPLAEGVLIIGIGKEGTKQLTQFLQGKEKEYIATIALGAISDTYDAEGKITPMRALPPAARGAGGGQTTDWPSKEKILKVLKQFQGEFLQTPPPFSAVKISGEPAYKLAREGQEVKIEPKKVFVSKIELLDYLPCSSPPARRGERTGRAEPLLKIRIVVQSGFYVRSFAQDLGKTLKTGAYLKQLSRTRVGNFKIEQAITKEDLEKDFLELYFKASGQVQGVFFRDTSRRWAKKLNLTGKAENLSNGGEIEIIAQGKEKALQMFLEKIKKGPAFARVDSFSHYFRKPQTLFQNFSIY